MSEQPEIVPYLASEAAHFRMDFVFFDLALTTSEIKPLHLSVPGTKHLGKKFQPRTVQPRSTQERQQPQKQQQMDSHRTKADDSPKETKGNENRTSESRPEKKPIQRLLSPNHSLNVRPHDQPASLHGTPEHEKDNKKATAIPRVSKNQSTTSSNPQLTKQQSNEAIPSKNAAVPKQNENPENAKKSQKPILPTQPTSLEFSLAGFYLLPCLPSQTIPLIFRIDKTKPNVLGFQLEAPDEYDDKLRMRIEVMGHTRGSSIETFYNDLPVGEYRYNPANKTFSVGITSLNPSVEAAAILFNPSYPSMDMPRIFDLIIPALKKIDGRNQMYKLAYGEQSTLIQCISRMAKESIRLKTKIPPSQNNVFDTTFNGKFKEPSPLNFILYHESNPKREIAVCSKIDETSYSLVVTYPLSPMQAFFAAAAISIPF